MDNDALLKASDDLLKAVGCNITFSETFGMLSEEVQQQLLPELSRVYNKHMTAAMSEIQAVIAKTLQ